MSVSSVLLCFSLIGGAVGKSCLLAFSVFCLSTYSVAGLISYRCSVFICVSARRGWSACVENFRERDLFFRCGRGRLLLQGVGVASGSWSPVMTAVSSCSECSALWYSTARLFLGSVLLPSGCTVRFFAFT